MSHELPKELTSLIHHIQLNEAGWWDRGIRQLILFVIWLNDTSSFENILEQLDQQFSIQLEPDRLRKHIDALNSAGVIISMPNANLKIAENKLKEFEAALKESQEIDQQVKAFFCELVTKHSPSLNPDETWAVFNDQLLLPLIQEIGAKTYELISGNGQDLQSTASFTSFVEQYHSDLHASLRDTIVDFLNPKQMSVRSYVLRNLNTYFFIEAGSLKEGTIDALLNLTERGHTLRLFLDTNIVFSVLGFHNNPSNEAVQSLLQVVKKLSGKINPQFYILPITVDETKRSLNIRKLELEKVRFSPNIASVAAELDDLSGTSKRFAEASLKTSHQLTPEEYFGPYLNNLIPILKGNSVELYNDNRLTSYSTQQKVIDDITEVLSFEENKYKDRAKSYDKVTHDMVLWHFVNDLRPVHLEAPFEAREWIVTIDYRLIAFDEYKQKGNPFRMPVCIHPASLIQMLQFWVPRTADFEKAIVKSLQLPFIFEEFDPDAERVTILILQNMSKYEGIEHLPRQSIAHIVLNDALRLKMKVEGDVQKQIELIRDAIVKENIRLSDQLNLTRQEAKQLKEELKGEKEKKDLSDQTQKEIQDYKGRVLSTEQQLIEQKELAIRQENKLVNTISKLKGIQMQKAQKQAGTVLAIITIFGVLIISGLCVFVLKPVLDNWAWIEPYAWVLSGAITLTLIFLGIKLNPFSWRESLKQSVSDKLYARKLRLLKDLENRLEADEENIS